MMKKIYICPEVDAVTISAVKVIASSKPGLNVDPDQSISGEELDVHPEKEWEIWSKEEEEYEEYADYHEEY